MANDELWKQYLAQIKRLNKFIDTKSKLGFKFPENVIPETPKKITKKSVERLQQMTPDVLYQQATYKVPETGEIVSGVVGKNMEIKKQKTRTPSVAVTPPHVSTPHTNATSETKEPKEPKIKSEQEIEEKVAKKIRAAKKREEKTLARESAEAAREKYAGITQKEYEKLSPLEKRKVTLEAIKKRKTETEEMYTFPKTKREQYYKDKTKMGSKKTGSPPDKTTAVINNTVSATTGGTLADIEKLIEEWTPLVKWTSAKNNSKWLSLEECKQNDKNSLKSILAGAILIEGKEAVAQRLEAKSIEAIKLVEEILYGSGSKEGNFKDGRTYVNNCLAAFSTLVMGRAMTPEERMDLEEEAESTEVYN